MTSHHTNTLRLWVVRFAVVSLLLVQSLGALHTLAHGPGRAAGSPAVEASAHGDAVVGFFGHHQRGDVDCRLFDQLSHADLSPPPLLAMPVVHSTTPAHALVPVSHQPAPTRSYCARGPPVLA